MNPFDRIYMYDLTQGPKDLLLALESVHLYDSLYVTLYVEALSLALGAINIEAKI